jgi:hypothetical protein
VCRFRSRCPAAQDRCAREAPELAAVPQAPPARAGTAAADGAPGVAGVAPLPAAHRAACHFAAVAPPAGGLPA